MSNFWGAYQKVLRTYKFKYAYSLKYLRVLTEVFTCTYHCKCAHSLKQVRRTYLRYLHLNMQGIKAMCPALPSWTHHSIYHLNGLLFYREDTQVVLNTTLHCKGTPTYRGGQYLTICILE